MLTYRVTISIAHTHESKWHKWMCTKHISDVLETGYFQGADIGKQLEPPPIDGHTTYHVSYHCESIEQFEQYKALEAAALQADHNEQFGGHFTANRTILDMQRTYSHK